MRFFWIFLFSATLSFGLERPVNFRMDSLICQGIDKTFRAQFDSALISFQKINQVLPDHPVGSFYIAALLQSKMMHYETDRWEKLFFSYIDTTIARSDACIMTQDEDPWIYFYRGNAYSYQGLYQAKRGHLAAGFINAKKGLDDLERAIKLAPDLYDAYIGIGNYKYWSGKFYKYLRWLPWIRDERYEGEADISIGMERGFYSHWLGLNSLGWIKYDSGDYNEAIRLFETGFKKFDGSLSWLWGLADAHKKAGHYQTALGFYEKIIKKVGSDSSESGYNEVVARWKVIQCMENLTMDTEIIRQAKCIQNAIVESSMLDRAKEYREKSREAGKRAEKRLKRAMNNSAEK